MCSLWCCHKGIHGVEGVCVRMVEDDSEIRGPLIPLLLEDEIGVVCGRTCFIIMVRDFCVGMRCVCACVYA